MEQFENLGDGSLSPDGKKIVFAANEFGHGKRVYIQEIDGGKTYAITPEGVDYFKHTISPDSKFFVGITTDKTVSIYHIDGGKARPILGVKNGEVPLEWSTDGSSYLRFHRTRFTGQDFSN
ncbi:hypothetical protein L0222_19180 [bacterium]|nr:hypothetical protein [bacterium]